MSGGYFEYLQYRVEQTSIDIQNVITVVGCSRLNGFPNEDSYAFSPEVISKFKIAVTALNRAVIMIHEIDYLLSGDTGEESFLQHWKDKLE